MKKINHGGRLTSSFLLLALMVYMIGCVGVGTAEPINPNNEGQDPYDWSNYPGEVILDAPEFIQGDDQDGAAEPGEMADSTETEQPSNTNPSQDFPGEQQESGDHIPLLPDDNTTGETGNEPASQNTEAPGEPENDQPAENGTDTPAQPADLKSLFTVEIKTPSGWFNVPEKAVRIKATPQVETLWDSVKYRLDEGDWQEVKKADFTLKDEYYYFDVTVTANCVLTVRLGKCEESFDTVKEIRLFDHKAPTVTAGFKEKVLHVEAPDDLSGAAGVQVNGLLFTTLENGQLDVRMEDLLLTYPQLAIRAYDYAGNFSEPITLDNPYYVAPTPTPKATKSPPSSPRRRLRLRLPQNPRKSPLEARFRKRTSRWWSLPCLSLRRSLPPPRNPL